MRQHRPRGSSYPEDGTSDPRCHELLNQDTSRRAACVTKIDDTYLDALSTATDMPVPQQNREGVRAQLHRLAQMADLVMSFSLPETEEPITKLRHE